MERPEPVPTPDAVKAIGEDRPPGVVLEARGDQPDDAGMPRVGGRHQDRRPRPARQFGIGLGPRLFEHRLLHRPAAPG